MLAQCQAQLHMRGEALASAAKAVDLDPDAGAARAIRGELLLRGGEARRAVTDLKLAADLLPREAEVLLRLALSCQKAEDARCARRFFRFALARDASLAEAHFGLALVDQQAGKLKEAWPSFKRAIALDPGNSRYYAGVAHFANLQKKAAAAASWLAEARRAGRLEKKLAKAAARNRKATTAMLELISWLKEGKECDLGCRKLLARLPRPAARFARAHLLGRSGGKKGAISAHLASVLGHLKSDKLFRTDPTKVEVRGRTVRGKNYVTKKSYPLVRLQALR